MRTYKPKIPPMGAANIPAHPQVSATAPAKRRGTWRRIGVFLAACLFSVVVAGLFAASLLRAYPNVTQAAAFMHSLRPWLLAFQVVALGLLWQTWPSLVAFVGRHRGLSASVQDKLIQARGRILAVLAAWVALMVLRVWAGN